MTAFDSSGNGNNGAISGPVAVSERLGHSTVAFTMDVYAAVIPSMGRAAADAAEQLFG